MGNYSLCSEIKEYWNYYCILIKSTSASPPALPNRVIDALAVVALGIWHGLILLSLKITAWLRGRPFAWYSNNFLEGPGLGFRTRHSTFVPLSSILLPVNLPVVYSCVVQVLILSVSCDRKQKAVSLPIYTFHSAMQVDITAAHGSKSDILSRINLPREMWGLASN